MAFIQMKVIKFRMTKDYLDLTFSGSTTWLMPLILSPTTPLIMLYFHSKCQITMLSRIQNMKMDAHSQ